MARNSASSFRSLIAPGLLLVPFLVGWSLPPDFIEFFNANIGKHIGVKLTPEQDPKKAEPAKKAPESEPAPPSPDHRQVNGEFIKELFKVVLRRDVRSEEEFAKYMNVMDQGGHYEGIYNGIIYSSEYKEKETGVAPIGALKMYADVIAQILLDQKYDPIKIHAAEEEKPDVPKQEQALAPPQPTPKEKEALVAEQQKDAMTKSLFTLKRRLGEEVLKTVDLKKEYKEKFATWYARFTVFLNKKGVDFGLAQRNKKDEYFHYKWALDADEDRLKWETLNRVHQLMNVHAK